ncbi:MAG: Tol-Pal system protein TolB [Rhodobacteraceae bacterium]|nr:Tol-Pal system protein TolB [Paracoccaceae bacterium]
MMRVPMVIVLGLCALGAPLAAQTTPLRIEITEGVIEPLPYAAPDFLAENPPATPYARDIAQIIRADLDSTGLFRPIQADAFVGEITSFSAPVQFADWQVINAQALLSGAVSVGEDDQLEVKFRLYDVFAGQELGSGLRFVGPVESWRRIAHKVADTVYARFTGESGYFDSRIVFVEETGPKDVRLKRLAIMDQDGANLSYLTDTSTIVLAPRLSPDRAQVLYTSYETGFPRVALMDIASGRHRLLQNQPGTMSFAPRFSPDGRQIVFSITRGGNSDLYLMDIASARTTQLTTAPSIETAPDFSPDGRSIVFESDRSGSQQLYIMPAGGGPAQRISKGRGRYGTPVWSPRGDSIAFTKQYQGRFHIGVMRIDGSEERLLTASFLDESPAWAPNGRVLIFTRVTRGTSGTAALYSVDLSGRNLRRIATEAGASDPNWSSLRQ